MAVERIYYDEIQSFKETMKLIKNQLEQGGQPLLRLNDIKGIIKQHEFIHEELY